MKTPELCATLFTTSFDALEEKLSDHQSMTKQEAIFRVKVARSAELAVMNRAEAIPPKVEKSIVKFEAPKMERHRQRRRRQSRSVRDTLGSRSLLSWGDRGVRCILERDHRREIGIGIALTMDESLFDTKTKILTELFIEI